MKPKIKFILIFLFYFIFVPSLYSKEKLEYDDVQKLGFFEMPNNLPEEMTKKFNSTCKEISCMAKKAGKELHYRFVIKKNSSNIFPGKMIQAMAWYEILYLDKLKNNELFIKRYLENYPNEYKNKIIDEIKIQSVLSMFEGRKNMRNALGIPNDEKPNVAITDFG